MIPHSRCLARRLAGSLAAQTHPVWAILHLVATVHHRPAPLYLCTSRTGTLLKTDPASHLRAQLAVQYSSTPCDRELAYPLHTEILPCHPEDLTATQEEIMAQRTPHQTGTAERVAEVQQEGPNDFLAILRRYQQDTVNTKEYMEKAMAELDQLPDSAFSNAEKLSHISMNIMVISDKLRSFFADVPSFEFVQSLDAVREQRAPQPNDACVAFSYNMRTQSFIITIGIQFRDGKRPDEDDHWIEVFRRNGNEHVKITRHATDPNVYLVRTYLSPLTPESRKEAPGQMLRVREAVSSRVAIGNTKPHLLPVDAQQQTSMEKFTNTAHTPTLSKTELRKKRRRASVSVAAARQSSGDDKGSSGGDGRDGNGNGPMDTSAPGTTAAAAGEAGETDDVACRPPPAKRARIAGEATVERDDGKSPRKRGSKPRKKKGPLPPAPARQVYYGVPDSAFALKAPVFTAPIKSIMERLTKLGTDDRKAVMAAERFLRMQFVGAAVKGNWLFIEDALNTFLHYSAYRVISDGKTRESFRGLVYNLYHHWQHVEFKDNLNAMPTDTRCALTGARLNIKRTVAVYIAPPNLTGSVDKVPAAHMADPPSEAQLEAHPVRPNVTGYYDSQLPLYCYYVTSKKLKLVEMTRKLFLLVSIFEQMRDSMTETDPATQKEELKTMMNSLLAIVSTLNKTLRLLYKTYTLNDIEVVTVT